MQIGCGSVNILLELLVTHDWYSIRCGKVSCTIGAGIHPRYYTPQDIYIYMYRLCIVGIRTHPPTKSVVTLNIDRLEC